MANSGNGRKRLENSLAFAMAGLIGLSVISIIAIPVVTVFFPKAGPIPVLVAFPWVALPTSALLLITLLVIQIRSKGKSN